MHNKIVKLHKELRGQYIWSQNVDEKEVINKHRFDMYCQRIAADFYIIDRYIRTSNDNDYNFIVENIIPNYKWYKGDGSYRGGGKQ